MAKNSIEEAERGNKRRHHYYAPQGEANYANIDAGRVLTAIATITKRGGAVRLGLTRDGGAFAIGIYGDGGEPYTDYLRPSDNVVSYLESVADGFEHA